MPSAETPIRILIIDDDEDDFFITGEYINNITTSVFHIEWCYNYHDALEKMKQHQFDIYLVDYRLGGKTGLDLLKEAIYHECEEPIVLLTGKGNQSIDKEAMHVGAADYLVKTELSTEKLERCIRYSLERHASLKALRANERKYRSIFEHSKDSVFVADEAMQFRDVNQATSELLGYDRNDLYSLSFYHLLTDKGMQQEMEEELSETGEVVDLEIELYTKSGDKKNCILSASKEIDVNGVTIQGIIHDITHLKKAEKATLQAEKLAAAGRLVRTLAHEVRNPLNNIDLSVEQVSQEMDSENIYTYLEIIQRNSKRIGDLITELLNSSGPAEMNMEKNSLQGIVDDSLAAALDRITLKKVKLQIHYADKRAYIIADKEKLRIAFLNIIINAVEAMPDERGILDITIEHGPFQHTVKISDNGSGVSDENLSRLFEPYFTSKRNGLGLGLAATLNIIQSHKSQIEVASKLGEGSTFIITLPSA